MENQRFPISVRMTGVMHKEKTKMYITSVLWSDQSDIAVYRTFEDFSKLHKQLKRNFPAASKVKKSERIIPKFGAKKAKQGGGKNLPNKSLARLKSLQKYCNELLSCDARVIQSGDLIQFFHPKDQDLQPEFSKNSVIILPSVDDAKADAGRQNGGSITQPFVTETYRCVATYETKDTKNKAFKVAVDEQVDVLIKDKGGWWLVESEDKRMAWFPAPYLEKLNDSDGEDDVDGFLDRGTMCTAIKNYKATKGDEISVSMGALVEVLQKSDNGWWLISYNGKVGYVPTMYLQPYNSPRVQLPGLNLDRPASSLSMLSAPSPTLGTSHQLSHSQGNLLQIPPAGSSSPRLLKPEAKQRSRSFDVLSERPPAQPARGTYAANTTNNTPVAAKRTPPPAIMVEMDGEEVQGGDPIPRPESQASVLSSSSDFSELSYSDNLSTSSAGSTLNLSRGAGEEWQRHARTPPPPSASGNQLSPTYGPLGGNMMPSTSDPSLYKRPASPRVPPRPQAQEILTRCTTITRNNAARNSPSLSPTPPEIVSEV